MRKNMILTNFYNLEILGLEHRIAENGQDPRIQYLGIAIPICEIMMFVMWHQQCIATVNSNNFWKFFLQFSSTGKSLEFFWQNSTQNFLLFWEILFKISVESWYFSTYDPVCHSVFCQLNYLRSYERILMKFYGGVVHGQGPRRKWFLHHIIITCADSLWTKFFIVTCDKKYRVTLQW